ncbi:leucine-rich repeat protein [uncultured Brachyspira sp.]|uniref:leucine-rich repeat protein n=1 Tax=uncultured Brachyspira sp. TaxID=221953 RepID=UPI002615DCC2|nr:leucine-rich repeat protein [uncultured Brachyspira sp.]
MVIDEAEKIGISDITMDIRNIEFQNGIINSSMFMGKPSENIVINFIFPENTITIIEDFAFNGLHKNLKEVKIPDSVKVIKSGAFSGSSGSQLTTVTYLGTSPNDITFDGKIFSSTQLKTLKIPNASNPNDPAWKTFLGYNFETVTR